MTPIRHILRHTPRFIATSFLSACLVLLAGCGTKTINIEGSYPSPLVSKLPLTLGVYYDADFKTHNFTEIDEYTGKEQYIINSGNSQVALFNAILPATFKEVVVLESLNNIASHPELDLVFAPAIEAFQVGLPEKTRLDAYEIWIKYNMRLSKTNGDYIADWVMTAYGKSPTASFVSAKAGINEAANLALRDLAASFSLGFSDIPGIKEWLGEQDSLLSEGF